MFDFNENDRFPDFFDYVKASFTTNDDFIYTFGKNLGGDMAGLSAYYLQNPLLFGTVSINRRRVLRKVPQYRYLTKQRDHNLILNRLVRLR